MVDVFEYFNKRYLSMNLNLKRIKKRDKECLVLYEVSSISHLFVIKKPLLTFEKTWTGT